MSNLNKSEWDTIVPILVMMASPWLAKLGISNEAAQNWLTALGMFVAGSYVVYKMWNMRRVAETSIVTGHAADAKTAVALSLPPPPVTGGHLASALVLGGLLALAAGHDRGWASETHVARNQTPAEFNAGTGAPGAVAQPASGATLAAVAGSVDSDLATIEKAINADVLADFTAAQAAYDALGDTQGSACNKSILDKLVAVNKAVASAPLPKVHMIFNFAIARNIVMAVQPGNAIYNACAPVADQVKQGVLQLVTGMITGATTILPALGVP